MTIIVILTCFLTCTLELTFLIFLSFSRLSDSWIKIKIYWSCFNKGWGEFFYEPDWLDGASAERALTFFYQARKYFTFTNIFLFSFYATFQLALSALSTSIVSGAMAERKEKFIMWYVSCASFFKGVTSSHLSSLPPSMYSPTLFLLIGYGQLSVKENKKPSSHPSFLHFLSSQVSKWLAQQTRC